MPSLPPLLKPWMMRPRAGQRNSGVEPEASASAAVVGGFALAAFGSTLPVGVLSMPGFLPAVAADGSALATTVLAGAAATLSEEALSFFLSATLSFDLPEDFSALFSPVFAFSSALSRTFRTFEPSSSIVRSDLLIFPGCRFGDRLAGARRSVGDGAAAGAVDWNDDVHAALDFCGLVRPLAFMSAAAGTP